MIWTELQRIHWTNTSDARSAGASTCRLHSFCRSSNTSVSVSLSVRPALNPRAAAVRNIRGVADRSIPTTLKAVQEGDGRAFHSNTATFLMWKRGARQVARTLRASRSWCPPPLPSPALARVVVAGGAFTLSAIHVRYSSTCQSGTSRRMSAERRPM